MLWKSTYALVVISPAITTSPVQVSVSQATRLNGSSARQASRIASEIWSAILSGWPSVTDSLVNKKRSRFAKSKFLQAECDPYGCDRKCVPSTRCGVRKVLCRESTLSLYLTRYGLKCLPRQRLFALVQRIDESQT